MEDEEVDFEGDVGDVEEIFVSDGEFMCIQQCRRASLEGGPEPSDQPLDNDREHMFSKVGPCFNSVDKNERRSLCENPLPTNSHGK
jgi:hypothetical protein